MTKINKEIIKYGIPSVIAGYLLASLCISNDIRFNFDGMFVRLMLLWIVFSMISLGVICLIRVCAEAANSLFPEKNSSEDISHLIYGTAVFFLSYRVFILAVADFPIHIAISEAWDFTSPDSFLNCSYCLLHSLSAVITKVLHIPTLYSFAIVLAISMATGYEIGIKIIRNYIPAAPRHIINGLFAAALFVQPVFIPWLSGYRVVGYSSPTMWHNPTNIIVRPFALMCSAMFISFINKKYSGQTVAIKEYVSFSFLLLLSVAAKPSFIQVFIPVAGLILIIDAIKTKSMGFGIKIVCSCIPAALYMCTVFMLTFVLKSENEASGLELSFFEVWRSYAPNVPVAIVMGLIAPIAIYVLVAPNVSGMKWEKIFVGLFFIISVLEFGLIAETGYRKFHGNMGWGYGVAHSVIWLFGLIELLKYMYNKDTVKVSNTRKEICIILIFLQLAYGIEFYYLFSQKITLY